MEKILATVWDVFKVLVIPLCIYLFQRQINKRDERREQEYSARKKELDEQQKENLQLQFLMMQRLDKLSELSHLMAQKLHDQGIINGDLEQLDRKYKELDDDYEKEVHRLALLYSKR